MNIFCLSSLSEVEQALTHMLENLDGCYIKNSLKLYPTKTQISAFHCNNRQARNELKMTGYLILNTLKHLHT